MFVLSFGAKSFTDFWRYWNPLYHYFLSYWIYKPLRKILPRSLAVILSFAFCGFFFHDILVILFTGKPLITIWFVLLGFGVVVSEATHMDLSNRPVSVRIAVNIAYLGGFFEIARRIILAWFTV